MDVLELILEAFLFCGRGRPGKHYQDKSWKGILVNSILKVCFFIIIILIICFVLGYFVKYFNLPPPGK